MPMDRSGEGWTRVGLDRGTRRGRAESRAVHAVHGQARGHGHGEDGVGRVKQDGGKSSRRAGSRKRKTWRRQGLAEAGHASTPRRSRGGQAEMDGLDGLGLKTIGEAGFPVWASKPGASPVWPELRGGGHVAPSRSLRRDEAKS